MNRERYINKLNKIKEFGNYRELKEIQHNGFLIHHDGREMLNLSSNDYLGLSSDPHLYEEFRQETDVKLLSYSAVSSRLLSGNHEYYGVLENDLRELYGKESALVFNSGYHANIGILPALAGKKDLIVADKLVHASIIDGLRLSEAEMLRYRHLDYGHLREILFNHREKYENVFVVTESIFSMDGDVCDLQELCDLKKEYDTFLYVDEAHAVGVRGTNGLGCCEEQGCMGDIDFIVGTFGKAFASYGAFVVCDDLFREFLVNTQRSLIFTTALPPINVAWTRFILNRMPDFYSKRLKLMTISERLRNTLIDRGFETRGNSHIVPFLCGSNENSVYMSEQFRDNGFFVLPVRYPTVPKNEARIRFSLNAAIPEEDYECLFEFIEVSC
ncbi:aminotransferase class I/II-fold pyridoxal phosphate-dependent enzyme [Gabonibacter massiliensis]|uniref:aminotransferase class I/II-fold pyridoxal phosphate-dependent enzyme n=1 Tax=Gabonibacter massiliensis TaxID=1720195 RepID=UPI00073E3AFA|nr:8-amino-7-oxononanoate synthase [Gabonibacter massiliensis]